MSAKPESVFTEPAEIDLRRFIGSMQKGNTKPNEKTTKSRTQTKTMNSNTGTDSEKPIQIEGGVENYEEYFQIELKSVTSEKSEYDIDFLINKRKQIDDMPDYLLDFYVLCDETFNIIDAIPIKPTKTEKEKTIRGKYVKGLYGIIQVGLQGEAPQPKLAKKALEKLKEEILMKEGGKIKNRHFVELGIKALILGVIAAALGFVFMQLAEGAFETFTFLINNNIYPYLFIFAGAMAGTWVSFGVRNLDMTFRDLAIMEEDMLKSFPRLFFVGVVSIIFMLFIDSTIITFDIGGIGTSDIMGSIELQILVGVVAGLLGNKLATGLYGKAKDAVKTGEDK